jgi:hypothetical protein
LKLNCNCFSVVQKTIGKTDWSPDTSSNICSDTSTDFVTNNAADGKIFVISNTRLMLEAIPLYCSQWFLTINSIAALSDATANSAAHSVSNI